MSRLYFKYGTMGSSKSAQALMAKFNYEQKGMKVLLLKPSLDDRGDSSKKHYVRSRIGLKSECNIFTPSTSIMNLYEKMVEENGNYDCVIVDEAQFCTREQVDDFKTITKDIPVLCYGLLTNFKCELFEGSKRIVELADSMTEIKSVCRCGKKSTVNARFINGKCVDEGPVVFIGGDESYENLCYWCWQKELEKVKNQK